MRTCQDARCSKADFCESLTGFGQFPPLCRFIFAIGSVPGPAINREIVDIYCWQFAR
jgi:hypothetical protein